MSLDAWLIIGAYILIGIFVASALDHFDDQDIGLG